MQAAAPAKTAITNQPRSRPSSHDSAISRAEHSAISTQPWFALCVPADAEQVSRGVRGDPISRNNCTPFRARTNTDSRSSESLAAPGHVFSVPEAPTHELCECSWGFRPARARTADVADAGGAGSPRAHAFPIEPQADVSRRRRPALTNDMRTIADETSLPRRALDRGDGESRRDDGARGHGAAEPEMVGLGYLPDELGLPPSFAQPARGTGGDGP
jgi:hypothetical protein